MRRPGAAQLSGGPLWYKDAVVYELSVRSFYDGDGDGFGDFPGLLQKLDYLEELGVTALWLQPFYPSPLRDDGYDVTDLTGVHPACGSLADFKHLLREAHRRGLRVLTELVVNHTSDQHPWFQRARRAPRGSRQRDFYVWSDDPRRYADARLLFPDAESSNWTWDAEAGAYYWHRFYAHEPDLNFDSPSVRREITRALDFWLELGVDGVRLDALSYLCESEGTACEDLPETHRVLRSLRAHVDQAHPGRVLMTETNLWPEEAASYFGRGDECHLASFTPLMPRLFAALSAEDRYPVVDVLDQTPALPEGAQWALHLRNHDELTLQMVSEEERDALYRAYAPDSQARLNLGIRRRLAPLLRNDRRQVELLNTLLFALPGTPVIYYGDELGMGDNIYLPDRDGVRTPMQWSADRNAGFSSANPQRVCLPPVVDPEFSFTAVNVAAQRDNPRSLLSWTRRLIAARRRLAPLGRGTLEFLRPANRKVLAFVRALGDERVLVVANLSRHAQHVELDLARFAGLRPVEVFGQVRFPAVSAAPYPLALAPHGSYWFTLEAPAGLAPAIRAQPAALPRVAVPAGWSGLFEGPGRTALEQALPDLLLSRRWFGGKARPMGGVELLDAIPLDAGPAAARLVLLQVAYAQGEPEVYALPLAFAMGEEAGRVRATFPQALLAEVDTAGGPGLLYAAEREPGFAERLLDLISRRRRLKGATGRLVGQVTGAHRRHRGAAPGELAASLLAAEQSNTSIRYGERLILKLFRKLEPGPNPDLEVGSFLTERARFANTPPVCGSLEYQPHEGTPTALAILQGFVPNEGDAWHFTLDAVARFFEETAARGLLRTPAPLPAGSLLDLAEAPDGELARSLVGPYLEAAALLGRRTGELHLALASDRRDPDFAPEPFARSDQRSLHQSARALTESVFVLLRQRLDALPPASRPAAAGLLARQGEVLERFRALVQRHLTARRTRTHGDYHLGQVLWTGRDFVIIDFEGEPARPLAARRAKRSPLRDVAGMLRSFHYAAFQGLAQHRAARHLHPDEDRQADSWADFWQLAASGAFLRADLLATRGAAFVPRGRDELHELLLAYLLEKAVYELAYELNNRPDWVGLPLRGVLQLLDRAQ